MLLPAQRDVKINSDEECTRVVRCVQVDVGIFEKNFVNYKKYT